MRSRSVAMAGVLAMLTPPLAAGAQAAGPDPASAQIRAQRDKAADSAADRLDGQGGCVYINQLQGDRPLNDRSVIFRANVSDYYRLDFAQRCIALTYPQPIVILTPVGGIGLVCHAIDLDVKVGEQGPGSIPVSCIPSAFHRMTATEVAAVPKTDLP